MSTFFDNIKRSYENVEITEKGINTSQFLEASESLVTLFGELLLKIGPELTGRSFGFNSICSCKERYEWEHQSKWRSNLLLLIAENPR